MIRTAVIALLAVLVTATLPGAMQVAPESDISGVYDCRGLNGDGSPYQGTVIISKHRDAYQIRWTFSSEQSAVGLGIRTGDSLAVSYYGGTPGVVLYQIKDEQLIGRWTVPGAGGVLASETLKKVKQLDPSDQKDEPAPEPKADETPRIRV